MSENQNFTPEMAEELENSLRRCSPETIEAAIAFRKTGDTSNLNTIILGIVERFLEPEKRGLLKLGDDSLNFVEDLALDSLTMVEIILLVEETIGISIDNEEVVKIKTVGNMKSFIAQTVNNS